MLLAKKHKRKPEYATRDHIIPRAKGGSSERGNIVAACAACNVRKGDLELGEFVQRYHPPALDTPSRDMPP